MREEAASAKIGLREEAAALGVIFVENCPTREWRKDFVENKLPSKGTFVLKINLRLFFFSDPDPLNSKCPELGHFNVRGTASVCLKWAGDKNPSQTLLFS